MEKVLITGGSGFIGTALANYLVDLGFHVNCLVRSENKSNNINISHHIGDIRDTQSLEAAMLGCKYVFHTAAIANAWMPDQSEFYQVNYVGTQNVFEIALKLGVEKVVFTSTAGIWANSSNAIINENSTRDIDFYLEYERTKFLAQGLCSEYADKGLDVVSVNPTRVFGPGPLTKSNSTTKMIIDYVTGHWHFVPGDGNIVANYVFVEDVIRGHLLALQHGRAGEAYILGGENVDYNTFFEKLAEVSQTKRRLFGIPRAPIQGIAYLGEQMTKLAPIDLKLTTGMVKKLYHNFTVSSDKAIKELGYEITPIDEALKKTLLWFKHSYASEVVSR